MSNEIDEHIAHLEAALDYMKRIAQPSAASPGPVATPSRRAVANAVQPRWALAARAFADRYPFNPWLVRRICANHERRIDASHDWAWAVKLAGTWHVDYDRFSEFADRVDRGLASFDSSEKSTSSLANGRQQDQKDSSNSNGDDEGMVESDQD
ncbi:hypothetical protein [Bradyrhizobium genomosp. I (2014)]|uniref:hypothetical protein n=1 Tax=Bradyrhizobium genomosp. I (2014) TaxID=2683269 RepID=UPI00054E8D87|nr:hypothetical protein [Bradyrhizobium sp. CCBAU 43298]